MTVYRRRGMSFLLLAFLSTPTLAADNAAGVASLYIDKPGSFEVLLSRAESNGTSAVFFGLIGAAVSAGARGGEDSVLEEEILPFIEDPSCDLTFAAALEERLHEKDYSLLTTAAEIATAPQIWIRIEACGFRLIDRETGEMAAFFAAEYGLFDAPERKARDLERLLLTGRSRYHWNDVTASPELAATEFEAVKVKAGRRMANKLIYANR